MISLLRFAFAIILTVMGLHTVWQALTAKPLVIGYGHGHEITIANPRWYHRGLWLLVGLVFSGGGLVFMIGGLNRF